MALNFLWCGYSSEEVVLAGPFAPRSAAQEASLAYIASRVDHFVDSDEVMPNTDWAAFLDLKRVSYDGGMLVKGLPLTWVQVEPGLVERS